MAIATASATFTNAAGLSSAAFTWTPALTSNPPKVLSTSVTMNTTAGGVAAFIIGTPTNTGGTIGITSPADCIVTITGSD